MDPVIEFRNVTYQYPLTETPAVKNIDLSLEPGKLYGIIGPNGAGKTTLAVMMCGFIPSFYKGTLQVCAAVQKILEVISMKAFNVIVKVLAALAAVAGAVYVVATYGDQIVAWAKKIFASLPKCPCCKEEPKAVEETAAEEAPAEEPAEEVPAEAPAEEAPVEEAPAAEVAANEPVAEEADFAE